MTFESAFLDLMPDTVIRTAFLRRSTAGTGEPSYATVSSTWSARIVAGPVKVRTVQGQEAVATHTLWVASTANFGMQDKFSVNGSTFQALEITRYPDEQGRHHCRIRCRGGAQP